LQDFAFEGSVERFGQRGVRARADGPNDSTSVISVEYRTLQGAPQSVGGVEGILNQYTSKDFARFCKELAVTTPRRCPGLVDELLAAHQFVSPAKYLAADRRASRLGVPSSAAS
jgi:hypothetical protein